MNAVVGILDDPFHAPVQYGLVETLLEEYQRKRRKILEIGNTVQGEIADAMTFFIEGNVPRDRRLTLNVPQLFDITGAVGALNAHYWERAISLTNVRDLMPQARRNEWAESITNQTCPDFVEEHVRPTLEHLLNSRQQFFAERVDGIYTALSDTHLTNNPMGFGKRMIISRVLDGYGTLCYPTIGFINDLRCVIAKFMGRDEPSHTASRNVVEFALRHRRGQWVTLDGGALRIRCYMVGTAHLEIHEDMAWRLNAILASIHPTAIPANFRTQKERKGKRAFKLMDRPLPFAVIEAISSMRRTPRQLIWSYSTGKAVRAEALKTLEAIGGIPMSDGVSFDYMYADVLDELLASGCIPDFKSHQFYPTPECLAESLVRMADVESHHRVLEPSAGTGNLARKIPSEHITCVEISPLHCEVLKALNLDPVQADFLAWAETTSERFDRVIANPPFSEGRHQAHLQAAAKLLVPGGRIASILPASCRGKDLLPGFVHEWSEVLDNQFAGTSVSVVMLVATAPATPLSSD